MVEIVAKVLRHSLAELTWIERFGGLVNPATRIIYGTTDDNQKVPIGSETWPVGCGLSFEDCFTENAYSFFKPNASLASVAFFVDEGGAALISTDGPKLSMGNYSFTVRFLVWMNAKRLGVNACNMAAPAAAFAMAKLAGVHQVSPAFAPGAVESQLLSKVTVTSVRQLVKSASMFEPFFFAQEGPIFLAPFDYFGLSIKGQYSVNHSCVPNALSSVQFQNNFCF